MKVKPGKKMSVSVQYDEDFFRRMKDRARQDGSTLAQLARDAIAIYLEIDPDVFIKAKRAAFLTVVRGALRSLDNTEERSL